MVVGLEDANFVIGELDTGESARDWYLCERDLREAFDQRELMFDLSPIGLCLFLGLLELVGRGILLEGDLTSLALMKGLNTASLTL